MVGKVGTLHPGEGIAIRSTRRHVKKLLPQASIEELDMLELRVQLSVSSSGGCLGTGCPHIRYACPLPRRRSTALSRSRERPPFSLALAESQNPLRNIANACALSHRHNLR